MKRDPLTPPQFVRLMLQSRKQGWPDEEIEKMLMESDKNESCDYQYLLSTFSSPYAPSKNVDIDNDSCG